MIKKILIIIAVLLLTGCTTVQKEETLGEITEVDPETIINLMDNKDDMFLIVTLSTCPICAEYMKVIDELIANYDVEVYHIIIDEYEDQYDELSDNYLDNLTDAPDSFFIVEGKIAKEDVGFIQYRDLITSLKEYGLVKQND